MARKDCLSASRARQHASGDSVRVSGGNARRGGRRGSRSGIRNRLLVGGQTFGSHGRSWAASAVSGGLVTRHYFLFPGHVFLLQNAHVEKLKSPGSKNFECLRAGDLKYYFRLIRNDFLCYFPLFFLACFSSTTT